MRSGGKGGQVERVVRREGCSQREKGCQNEREVLWKGRLRGKGVMNENEVRKKRGLEEREVRRKESTREREVRMIESTKGKGE